MPVGFDTTLLHLLLNPYTGIPLDPTTSQPISDPKLRIEYLIAVLQKDREKIVIPTPVVAEILSVIGPEAKEYFDIINRSRLFEEAPFDMRCAIELALLNRTVFRKADNQNHLGPYQKVKFDRQIIAVFKVSGVDQVYSDDNGVAARAKMCGMKVTHTYELPKPPIDPQGKLPLESPEEIPEPEDGGDDAQ